MTFPVGQDTMFAFMLSKFNCVLEYQNFRDYKCSLLQSIIESIRIWHNGAVFASTRNQNEVGFSSVNLLLSFFIECDPCIEQWGFQIF